MARTREQVAAELARVAKHKLTPEQIADGIVYGYATVRVYYNNNLGLVGELRELPLIVGANESQFHKGERTLLETALFDSNIHLDITRVHTVARLRDLPPV